MENDSQIEGKEKIKDILSRGPKYEREMNERRELDIRDIILKA